MAAFVGVHNRVYIGHLDLSGKANEVQFGPLARAMQNFTTFNDGGFTVVRPGLISGASMVKGFQDFDADVLDDDLGVAALGAQYPQTVIPNPTGTVTAGDACWLSRGLVGTYNPLEGAKGDPGGFQIDMPYDAAIVQAKVLHPLGAETADGNGTAVAMGGPTAAQRLYASLHVIAYSGLTDAVIKVQSDDSGAMSSATDRITFATVTGRTSEFASVAGSFSSETHVRTTIDVTGTGSITFVAAAGVI